MGELRRLTLTVAPYLKLPVQQGAVNSVTRGLVGDTAFAVLPDITPRMTFVLTLMAQIVRGVVIREGSV